MVNSESERKKRPSYFWVQRHIKKVLFEDASLKKIEIERERDRLKKRYGKLCVSDGDVAEKKKK